MKLFYRQYISERGEANIFSNHFLDFFFRFRSSFFFLVRVKHKVRQKLSYHPEGSFSTLKQSILVAVSFVRTCLAPPPHSFKDLPVES